MYFLLSFREHAYSFFHFSRPTTHPLNGDFCSTHTSFFLLWSNPLDRLFLISFTYALNRAFISLTRLICSIVLITCVFWLPKTLEHSTVQNVLSIRLWRHSYMCILKNYCVKSKADHKKCGHVFPYFRPYYFRILPYRVCVFLWKLRSFFSSPSFTLVFFVSPHLPVSYLTSCIRVCVKHCNHTRGKKGNLFWLALLKLIVQSLNIQLILKS